MNKGKKEAPKSRWVVSNPNRSWWQFAGSWVHTYEQENKDNNHYLNRTIILNGKENTWPKWNRLSRKNPLRQDKTISSILSLVEKASSLSFLRQFQPHLSRLQVLLVSYCLVCVHEAFFPLNFFWTLPLSIENVFIVPRLLPSTYFLISIVLTEILHAPHLGAWWDFFILTSSTVLKDQQFTVLINT